MAFDGVVISAIIHELNDFVLGGRIGKVNQPEKDELVLTVRKDRKNSKLLLSSMASMPKFHLTEITKTNPLTAPNFCMLLRKHLVGGTIIGITQPNFERIIRFDVENYDELGVLVTRSLIIEIMGRHSNIILVDEEDNILDAVRRVGAQISSVREVFPGRTYQLPPDQGKANPLEVTSLDQFMGAVTKDYTIQKGLYQSITGLSPQLAEALCYQAGLNGSTHTEEINQQQWEKLYTAFVQLTTTIRENTYEPCIYMGNDGAFEAFSVVPLTFMAQHTKKDYLSPSVMVEDFYRMNNIRSRIAQRSSDLRKLVHTNLERSYKKLNIQLQQIADTDGRDKFRIRGELINANLYKIQEGDTSVTVIDYYNDNKEIKITLDPRLNPSQNAQKQFNKYNKKKRTLAALSEHIETTKAEIKHLESVKYALEHALTEEDLHEIRQELMETGYVRFRKSKKEKAFRKAAPLHYLSSDGFHMYVGKNNFQNEYLSTKFANGGDWWFHAKDVPGSHVIVKSENRELPDRTYEEAAALAAYYSKGNSAPKVSVDYTLKKHLKKPNGSAPGYVIYHTNYSFMAAPSLEGLTLIED